MNSFSHHPSVLQSLAQPGLGYDLIGQVVQADLCNEWTPLFVCVCVNAHALNLYSFRKWMHILHMCKNVCTL